MNCKKTGDCTVRTRFEGRRRGIHKMKKVKLDERKLNRRKNHPTFIIKPFEMYRCNYISVLLLLIASQQIRGKSKCILISVSLLYVYYIWYMQLVSCSKSSCTVCVNFSVFTSTNSCFPFRKAFDIFVFEIE